MMRTNNVKKFITIFMAGSMLLLSGCGRQAVVMPYDMASSNTAFILKEDANSAAFADPFALNLCVTGSGSKTAGSSLNLGEVGAVALFDLNKAETLYARNAHAQMQPASLTKVMTALIALKRGNPDDIITASENVAIKESRASLCGLKAGDRLTLSQALYALLMQSANDAGVAIAEHIAGSVEEFADLMNEEAKRLGATKTSFKNPHGLTEDSHYTTAYDLYLIFNEAIKYDTFIEIIRTVSYSSTYTDKNGNPKELKCETTNQYLKGTSPMPENITVIGGKTGTTSAARSCLILLSKDAAGNPYISVILSSPERPILYGQMTGLLEEINK